MQGLKKTNKKQVAKLLRDKVDLKAQSIKGGRFPTKTSVQK